MRQMVAEAIQRIYVQRDIGFVKSLQAKVLNGIQLPELQAFAEANNLRIRQLYGLPEEKEEEKEEDQPLYWAWDIGFDVEKGAFQAEYGSGIRISAAVPVFSIGHGANLENNLPDPKERMSLSLETGGEEPLTRVQAELHEILKRAGYVQFSDAEMKECVHFLRWEEELTHVEGKDLRMVGANVTVEDCLFNPYFDSGLLFTLKHARVVERNEPLDIPPGLAEVVERVYRQGDEAFFREQCQKPCEIPEPVRVYARENGIRVEERNQVGGPECQWTFHYPEYVNGEFRVRFNTKVWVSKLAPVFYFSHGSEVDNRAPDAITPVLKGESWEEKIILQGYLFDERLRPLLEEMGYEDIDGISQTACVHWLEWKQPGEHGENVTVEDCLFRDIRSQVQFRRSMGI